MNNSFSRIHWILSQSKIYVVMAEFQDYILLMKIGGALLLVIIRLESYFDQFWEDEAMRGLPN